MVPAVLAYRQQALRSGTIATPNGARVGVTTARSTIVWQSATGPAAWVSRTANVGARHAAHAHSTLLSVNLCATGPTSAAPAGHASPARTNDGRRVERVSACVNATMATPVEVIAPRGCAEDRGSGSRTCTRSTSERARLYVVLSFYSAFYAECTSFDQFSTVLSRRSPHRHATLLLPYYPDRPVAGHFPGDPRSPSSQPQTSDFPANLLHHRRGRLPWLEERVE